MLQRLHYFEHSHIAGIDHIFYIFGALHRALSEVVRYLSIGNRMFKGVCRVRSLSEARPSSFRVRLPGRNVREVTDTLQGVVTDLEVSIPLHFIELHLLGPLLLWDDTRSRLRHWLEKASHVRFNQKLSEALLR